MRPPGKIKDTPPPAPPEPQSKRQLLGFSHAFLSIFTRVRLYAVLVPSGKIGYIWPRDKYVRQQPRVLDLKNDLPAKGTQGNLVHVGDE